MPLPSPTPVRPRTPTRVLTLVLAVILATALLPATGTAQGSTHAMPAAAPTDPPDDKVATELRKKLADTPTDFYVFLEDRADLSGLRAEKSHADRTARGRAELVRTAEGSQQALRQLLTEADAPFQSFWIVNAVHVERGDAELADRIAKLPSVSHLRQVSDIELVDTEPDQGSSSREEQPLAEETAWGVSDIGAPQAWDESDARGQGVVVASIDTGVDFEHEALVDSYRGNRGDGTFDHDYNWYDPAEDCGEPCDNDGHGTHTTGTIAGGGPHQIGVAPDATWIAAKGCGVAVCPTEALLASGEWVIAPTDLSGGSPRPELAPNIVNNSWGAVSHDPFYDEIVQRWREMGILPVFAAGNAGPACDTMGSPADYPTTYAVAAYDADHNIADFSSRGADAGPQPDIAAPGVDILSASADGGYYRARGTSMAAPHLAGAAAVLWSHSPQLFGAPQATREVLGASAVDAGDSSCGGDASNNGAFGEGRLDLPAALAAAPDDPLGTLRLTVTRADDAAPVSGASVTATAVGSERVRRTVTGSSGHSELVLPTGDYQVSSQAFGLQQGSRDVTLTEGAVTEVELALDPKPTYTITGRVLDTAGSPVTGSLVQLHGTPLETATTDGEGQFRIDGVPNGTYTMSASEAGCTLATSDEVTVSSQDDSVDLRPSARIDAFDQSCYRTSPEPVTTTEVQPITGDDTFGEITLPFRFPFYQEAYDTAWVGSNGFLSFTAGATMPINSPLPHGGRPNAAVMPFWDDLVIDDQAEIRTGGDGTQPNRRFAVEWRDALIYGTDERITVQAVLHENGSVVFEYVELGDSDRARGDSATAGMEDAAGEIAVPINGNTPWLRSGTAYRADVPAVLRGRITDLDSGDPLAGVTVHVSRESGREPRTTTGQDGRYTLPLPYGDHDVVANLTEYAPVSGDISLTAEEPEGSLDLVLDRNSVSGTVTGPDGAPVADARITTSGVDERSVRTDTDGTYRVPAVPAGDLTVTVEADRCLDSPSRTVTVEGEEQADFDLVQRTGSGGYQCVSTTGDALAVDTQLSLTGDEEGMEVDLPFDFPFYGTTQTTGMVSTNGALTFDGRVASWANDPLPDPTWPHGGIYPFWEDLEIDADASVWTGTVGDGAEQRFVVEWRNAAFFVGGPRTTFQLVLAPDGAITFHYRDIGSSNDAAGDYASIGIEALDDEIGFGYSYAREVVEEDLTITFRHGG